MTPLADDLNFFLAVISCFVYSAFPLVKYYFLNHVAFGTLERAKIDAFLNSRISYRSGSNSCNAFPGYSY